MVDSDGLGYQPRAHLPHGADARATLHAKASQADRRREDGLSIIITDRGRFADGPELYKKFRDREKGCIKVVMKP